MENLFVGCFSGYLPCTNTPGSAPPAQLQAVAPLPEASLAKLFDPCRCPPTASLCPSTHGTSYPGVPWCALHGKHVPALQESREPWQIPVLQRICIFYAGMSKANPVSWCVRAGTTAATAIWYGTRERCTTVMRWCSSRASHRCPAGRVS